MEFNLKHPDIEFDCYNAYWCARIPGDRITKPDCASPYEIVTTVSYRTKCGDPAPIVGRCKLPAVTFYHSER